MCSFDSIIVILKRKHLTQRDLANHLGLGETTVAAWKSGRSEAWRKYLPEIAEFLGVTVDDLLGAPTAAGIIPFNLDQKRVIELLTRLDDVDLIRLEGMITLMLADEKYKKKRPCPGRLILYTYI